MQNLQCRHFKRKNEMDMELKHGFGKLEKGWSMVKAERLVKYPWITCSWNGKTHGHPIPKTLAIEFNRILI